ncbi:MAG: dephospho-CoA kinase [Ktedonobacteraceae bacterium]
MHIIGLTGNIACGKTFVGQILLELGVERYIDADAIVHRLYQAGQPIALKVGETFGPDMLEADGSINRPVLGNLVFQNPEEMRKLEQIVHPAVGVALQQEITAASEHGIVVIDAVKLLEGESGQLCQSKWLVICSQEQEIARLMQRNNLDREAVAARIRAQPDVTPKLSLVDEVIDNSGTRDETRQQVNAAFERFLKRLK